LRIALAYNPRMAGHRLGRVASLVRALEARGDSVSHHDSLTFDCARDAPDAELLCVGGGDGTVRMVVGRQDNPGALPPIAVFPVGTINLVARELGYPKSPKAFIKRIEHDRAVHSPLAELNGDPFVACLSVGVDALLVKWPLHRLTVRTQHEEFEAEALFVLRAKFYAGPWTLHPEAHLGHDALRVLALPRARRRDVVSLAARALGGMRAPHPEWRYLETDWIDVTSDQPVPVQADGDSVGLLPARIEMSGKSVRFR
jgi:diacylglycerol kinase (ATP)